MHADCKFVGTAQARQRVAGRSGDGIGASRRALRGWPVGRGWLGDVFGQQMWETLGGGGVGWLWNEFLVLARASGWCVAIGVEVFGDVGGGEAWSGGFDTADIRALDVEAVAEEEEHLFDVLADGANDVLSEEGGIATMLTFHAAGATSQII